MQNEWSSCCKASLITVIKEGKQYSTVGTGVCCLKTSVGHLRRSLQLCHRCCGQLCEQLQLFLQGNVSTRLWHLYPNETSAAVAKGQDENQEARKGGGFIVLLHRICLFRSLLVLIKGNLITCRLQF